MSEKCLCGENGDLRKANVECWQELFQFSVFFLFFVFRSIIRHGCSLETRMLNHGTFSRIFYQSFLLENTTFPTASILFCYFAVNAFKIRRTFNGRTKLCAVEISITHCLEKISEPFLFRNCTNFVVFAIFYFRLFLFV